MAWSIFNLFQRKNVYGEHNFQVPIAVKEEKASIQNTKEAYKAITKTIKGIIRYTFTRENNLEYPDNVFYIIRQALKTDSYISQSTNKYKEKMLKASYYLDAEDEIVQYLNKRFKYMSFMNEVTMRTFIQEMCDDLIDYSNAFFYKIRKDTLPLDVKGFLGENPVCGYMRVDPADVIIEKDEYNNIKNYIIRGHEADQKISPNNMGHIFIDRPADSKYGTPRLCPVLEDVKCLREIEGDILTLIHRFCFPLYHAKIGLPQAGFHGSQTDVDMFKSEIANMQEDGMIITNEKVEIKAIGAESVALDVLGYANYFEKRAFTGLNTSETQMGRDNNNTNPEAIEAQIHDSVKFYQKAIADSITHQIIYELLFEGGYNPLENEKHECSFVFNEISQDTKIKTENHEMLKYQTNIQSLEEARRHMGMRKCDDQGDFYIQNVTNATTKYKAQVEASEQIRVNKASAAIAASSEDASSASSTSSAKKDSTRVSSSKSSNTKSKAVKTNNMPQNQHGVYSVKVKEALKNAKSSNKIFENICKCYKQLCNCLYIEKDCKECVKKLKESFYELVDQEYKLSKTYADLYFGKEAELSIEETNAFLFHQMIDADIDKLLKDLKEKSKTTPSTLVMAALEHRLNFIQNYIPKKYYWYVFALCARNLGYEKLYIKPHSEKDKMIYEEEISLLTINIDKLPPLHPFCQSELILKKGAASDGKKKTN